MNEYPTHDDFRRHSQGEMNRLEALRFEQHLQTDPTARQEYEEFLRQEQAAVTEILPPKQPSPPAVMEFDETTGVTGTEPVPDIPAYSDREPRFPDVEGYVIKRVLGRGGMGVVYEATQTKLNRTVALKFLPAVSVAAHPQLRGRFRLEAEAAGRLHHTHIVPVYDFGECSDGLYYAMELLDGQPLNELVPRFQSMDALQATHADIASVVTEGRLGGSTGFVDTPSRESREAGRPSSVTASMGSMCRPYFQHVASWFADAADALHYAHVKGLIHRDVKPSNLVLCRDGRIMILDFGLVKAEGDRSVTATGSLIGTYQYMSPEQIGAQRISVDRRSDVYSLGATLYEMITFQPLFCSAEQSELLSTILFAEPTPPRKIVPNVPTDLQTVCLKALEKDPGARYQTAKDFADDLRRFLHDETIVAKAQGPLRTSIKFVRRHRLETITVLALIAALAVTAFGTRAYHGWVKSQEEARAARADDLVTKGWLAHAEENDHTEAVRLFEQALSEDPQSYRALASFAIVLKDQYLSHGDEALLGRAGDLIQRAIEADPQRDEAWNVRGVLYMLQGLPEEAFDSFVQARELDSEYYPIWANLALHSALQRNLEDALNYARQATELLGENKDPVPWRFRTAIELARRKLEGDWPDLQQTFRQANRASGGSDIVIRVLLSEYHLVEGRTKESLHSAIAATELLDAQFSDNRSYTCSHETAGRARLALALASLRCKDWAGAVEASTDAVNIGAPSVQCNLIRSIALSMQGNIDAAKDALHQAEEDWPKELEEAQFLVSSADLRALWLDTAESIQELRREAREVLGEPVREPSAPPKNGQALGGPQAGEETMPHFPEP